MEARNDRSLRVLMFPWLAYGHISPFLELGKKLANKNFEIYLCSSPINLASIKETIPKIYENSIQLIELPLQSLPDLPPHHHTTNDLPPHLLTTLNRAFEMSSSNFSSIIKTILPDLLIYDYRPTWAADAAASLNIPSVYMCVSGTAATSFTTYALTCQDPKDFRYPFPEIYLRDYELVKMKKAWEEECRKSDKKEATQFLECANKSSGVILVPSFMELEGKYIDFYSKLTCKKIVPMGPLVKEYMDDGEEKEEIIEWLDNKDKGSVVFVSFGSECYLSNEELEELAYGLEDSYVNFIWVVRFPGEHKLSVEEALPKGFLERVYNRGKVVENWAPQAKILKHPNIGGFVSHCGWNSTMESIKNGVPIIAMPMRVEQPYTARLLGDVGVAKEVVREKDGILRREEISKVIREVVVEKSGEGVREKVRKISERMRIRSDEVVDEVVEVLLQVCKKEPVSDDVLI